MHGAGRLYPSFRRLTHGRVARYASTKTQRTVEDNDGDFRPPWVYSGSRFLTYTTIPLTILYCTFLADWGEREHIFTPLRRWVSEHTQSILSLSPEESALAQGSKASSSPPQKVD